MHCFQNPKRMIPWNVSLPREFDVDTILNNFFLLKFSYFMV
jgi:hypothetical protein